MKIGILGSGNVGGTLGTRWAQGGHSVVFGTRKPDSQEIRDLVAKAGLNACASSNADAVAASEVAVLTAPFGATKGLLTGLRNLAGKILIDATNPVLADLSGLEVGTTTSAGEQVAQWAGGARVVKAFNTVGYSIMADPAFGEAKPVMFYCGDDAAAKKVVAQLVSELGFDAEDAGPLTQARVLEPFAMLWISLAYKTGFGRDFAFQVIRR